MKSIAEFMFVLVTMIVLDIVWAQYTAAVADKKPLRSAFMSVGTVLGGAVLTFAYLWDGTVMVIASALGAFIGTFISVAHSKAQDDMENLP